MTENESDLQIALLLIDELKKENKKLIDQNQKMKCCGNCAKTHDCKCWIGCQSNNYEDWELIRC